MNHRPALDGLRGIAIGLVFLVHATGVLDPATPLEWFVVRSTGVGWVGVDLFFVISGFLITGILLDSRDKPARWRNFFARRVLRIFPLYYGVLVGLFIILPRVWSHPELAQLQADQAWFWGYAVNFLELLHPASWPPLSVGHLWSLAIEEQFYLAWPPIVWACRPRTLLRLVATIMGVGLLCRIWFAAADPFGTSWASYLFTPTHLDGLMVGAALAVAERSETGRAWVRRWAPAALGWCGAALVVLAVVRGGLRGNDWAMAVVGFPLVAGFFGALLVAALDPGRVATICEHRVLRWVGKYSYGLYVFHFPVISALARKGPWSTGMRLADLVPFIAVAAALSCLIAWVSYNGYEKHFLALKRHFVSAARTRQ